MQYSTVLIIPVALLTEVNALGAAIGHGPENYTVPLSSDGETITHFSGHTYATEDFFYMAAAAMGGSLPDEDWAEFGLTPQKVGEVMAALFISAPGSPMDPEGEPYSSPRDHFASVLEAKGLQVAS